jgi:hypothetical protein
MRARCASGSCSYCSGVMTSPLPGREKAGDAAERCPRGRLLQLREGPFLALADLRVDLLGAVAVLLALEHGRDGPAQLLDEVVQVLAQLHAAPAR